jgi:3-oxoacyl-[acyl-carrier protein] reductase
MLENGGGDIVNILGLSVFMGIPGKVAVMANKAGIPGLTRGLALEFGPDGIRANALCLGRIEVDRDIENYPNWEKYKDDLLNLSALRRTGSPEEVADVCCFFVSDKSSLITGQVLHVNAGLFPIFDISNV